MNKYVVLGIFASGVTMLTIAATPEKLSGQASYVPSYDEYCQLFPDRCAKHSQSSSSVSSPKPTFFQRLFGFPRENSAAPDSPGMMPYFLSSSSSSSSRPSSAASSAMTTNLTVNPRTAFSFCGNNRIDQGEACDDGDRASGDGCSATCQREDGFVCPGAGQSCFDCTAILCQDGRSFQRCNGSVRVNYFDDPCRVSSSSSSRSSSASSLTQSSAQASSQQVTNTTSSIAPCKAVPHLILSGDKTSPKEKDYTLKIAAANNSDCVGYKAKLTIEAYGFDYVRSESLNCTQVPWVSGANCQLGDLAARTGTFGSFIFRPSTPYCNADQSFSVFLFMEWPGMMEDDPHHAYRNFDVTVTCPVSSSSAPPPSSSSVSSSSTVTQGVDLSLTQLSQFIVSCRQSLQAQFTITNNGTAPATNVMLKNPLPGGTTFVTSDRGDSCSQDGSTVHCSMGRIEPGESKNILLMINVNAGYRGYITNVATVSTSDSDVNQSNNVASFRSQAFCYDN